MDTTFIQGDLFAMDETSVPIVGWTTSSEAIYDRSGSRPPQVKFVTNGINVFPQDGFEEGQFASFIATYTLGRDSLEVAGGDIDLEVDESVRDQVWTDGLRELLGEVDYFGADNPQYPIQIRTVCISTCSQDRITRNLERLGVRYSYKAVEDPDGRSTARNKLEPQEVVFTIDYQELLEALNF